MGVVVREDRDLCSLLDARCIEPGCLLGWLGQAGFLIRCRDLVLVVDPYLSDTLAAKYRNTVFPHVRLMPPPIAALDLAPLGAVFCTHAHSDHMDPETIPFLKWRNPRAWFVVPRAARETALRRGVPPGRMIATNAGERMQVLPGLSVRVVASAHEYLRTDGQGNHHYLGYVIELQDAVIYHSGDCVPYAGLARRLARRHIDLAILPVNGRDEYRRQNGVSGNFTVAEAAALCCKSGIPSLMACHFGMFAFNTVDESLLDVQLAGLGGPLQCVRPVPGQVYQVDRLPRSARSDARSVQGGA